MPLQMVSQSEEAKSFLGEEVHNQSQLSAESRTNNKNFNNNNASKDNIKGYL